MRRLFYVALVFLGLSVLPAQAAEWINGTISNANLRRLPWSYNLLPDMVVERESATTYVNSDGQIVKANGQFAQLIDVDHISPDDTNTWWTGGAASISADGGIVANAVDTIHRIHKTNILSANTTYAVSLRVKPGAKDWIALLTAFDGNSAGMYINVNTGEPESTIPAQFENVAVGDADADGYRLVSYTTDVGSVDINNSFTVYVAHDDGDVTFSGDGSTVSVYVKDINLVEIPTATTLTLDLPLDTVYADSTTSPPVIENGYYRLVGSSYIELVGDIDLSEWSKTANITRTTGHADPMGGTQAVYIVGDAASAYGEAISKSGFSSLVDDEIYTVSFYVKSDSLNEDEPFRITIRDATESAWRADVTFTWTNGVPAVGVETAGTGFVDEIGNGWYRVAVACPASVIVGANNNTILLYPQTSADESSFYIYGPNLTNTPYPFPFIPSENGQTFVDADAATISLSDTEYDLFQDGFSWAVTGTLKFGCGYEDVAGVQGLMSVRGNDSRYSLMFMDYAGEINTYDGVTGVEIDVNYMRHEVFNVELYGRNGENIGIRSQQEGEEWSAWDEDTYTGNMDADDPDKWIQFMLNNTEVMYFKNFILYDDPSRIGK